MNPSNPQRTAEQMALQALLDAVDARSGDLPSLVAGRPREGLFFGVLEQVGARDREVVLLLTVLAARLDGRAALTGAELGAAASNRSAGRLAALGCLDADGLLVRRGLLVPDHTPDEGIAVLDLAFRLGAPLFERACRVFASKDVAPDVRPRDAYRTNTELLADLRRLSLLYRRRAARIFHLDPWSGTGLESLEGTEDLVAQSCAEMVRIGERLRTTSVTERMPLMRLAEQHSLTVDDLVILVTVLFQELVEGVGTVDAVDLVKLVSESEAELVRRRTMLRPLDACRLLLLEGAYAGKELTADASLPEETIEAMLGAPKGIHADERIDFHSYLQQLQSSEDFFQDLDGGLS